MLGRIAVEPALTNVKDFLSQNGYTVETMDEQSPTDLKAFDAIVVTGMNKDLLGMQDVGTRTFVINADGLSPQEVADRLRSGQ